MLHLYLKSSLSFREVADQIAQRLLTEFDVQQRYGLNRGGGDYFLYTRGETELVLVSNDAAHPDVFESERAAFPYYCYMDRGSDDILRTMFAELPLGGLEGELVDV